MDSAMKIFSAKVVTSDMEKVEKATVKYNMFMYIQIYVWHIYPCLSLLFNLTLKKNDSRKISL